MLAKLDLHIHSQSSPDGQEILEDIVARARALGLQGVAVCDHDRVLTDPPMQEDFLLIPGAEFSTEYGHLLGLFLSEPIEWTDFSELIEAIHAQGGLAVLAHPFEHSGDPNRIEPIACLLDGVEIWNGRANRKNRRANQMAADFAEAHDLPGFGGSDAHVLREIGNGCVAVEVDALTPEAVKAALLRRGNTVSGTEGRSLDVARSQLTLRKKSRARPRSYLKWAAFAAKCWAEDVIRRR